MRPSASRSGVYLQMPHMSFGIDVLGWCRKRGRRTEIKESNDLVAVFEAELDVKAAIEHGPARSPDAAESLREGRHLHRHHRTPRRHLLLQRMHHDTVTGLGDDDDHQRSSQWHLRRAFDNVGRLSGSDGGSFHHRAQPLQTLSLGNDELVGPQFLEIRHPQCRPENGLECYAVGRRRLQRRARSSGQQQGDGVHQSHP